jgi:hypothetical protein
MRIKTFRKMNCTCVDTWSKTARAPDRDALDKGYAKHGANAGGRDCFCKIGGKMRNGIILGGKLVRIGKLEMDGPRRKKT